MLYPVSVMSGAGATCTQMFTGAVFVKTLHTVSPSAATIYVIEETGALTAIGTGAGQTHDIQRKILGVKSPAIVSGERTTLELAL